MKERTRQARNRAEHPKKPSPTAARSEKHAMIRKRTLRPLRSPSGFHRRERPGILNIPRPTSPQKRRWPGRLKRASRPHGAQCKLASIAARKPSNYPESKRRRGTCCIPEPTPRGPCGTRRRPTFRDNQNEGCTSGGRSPRQDRFDPGRGMRGSGKTRRRSSVARAEARTRPKANSPPLRPAGRSLAYGSRGT